MSDTLSAKELQQLIGCLSLEKQLLSEMIGPEDCGHLITAVSVLDWHLSKLRLDLVLKEECELAECASSQLMQDSASI